MTRLRPLLARGILALFFVAAVLSGVRIDFLRRNVDPSPVQERRELRYFARRVGVLTEPGAVIAFEVHEKFRDEGYVVQRLQHLLPGRRAALERDGAHFLAQFAIADSPGDGWRLRWRHGQGSLWERAR